MFFPEDSSSNGFFWQIIRIFDFSWACLAILDIYSHGLLMGTAHQVRWDQKYKGNIHLKPKSDEKLTNLHANITVKQKTTLRFIYFRERVWFTLVSHRPLSVYFLNHL